MEGKVFDYFKKNINDLDGIILQDYNKGVLTESLITKIVDEANEKNKLITVDPKFDNFWNYKNVTVFKPNLKETEEIKKTSQIVS